MSEQWKSRQQSVKPRRLQISEILKEVDQAKSKKEKQLILLQNDTKWLRSVLWNNFHPNSKFWAIPDGDIPAVKHDGTPIELSVTILGQAAKILNILQESHPADVKKKERVFLQYYEGMHPMERNIFVNVVRHNLQNVIDGLTYSLVRDTFEDLLPEKKPVKKGKASGKKKVSKGTRKKSVKKDTDNESGEGVSSNDAEGA